TNAEFNLLVAFLAAPQRVLTRSQLLDLSRLHNDEVYDRAIDVQVGRLRRKLIDSSAHSSPVKTERGVGYVFALPAEPVY
ncbi:MAG: winged helix-turn-helix domain-containing protein, partial [Burkholderiales bacterium]